MSIELAKQNNASSLFRNNKSIQSHSHFFCHLNSTLLGGGCMKDRRNSCFKMMHVRKKSSNTKISLPVWATCSQKHMILGRELQYTNLHTIDSSKHACFILKTCTAIYYPFIGSILQSRDIVMHPENRPKVWYPYALWSCGVQ